MSVLDFLEFPEFFLSNTISSSEQPAEIFSKGKEQDTFKLTMIF